MITRLNTVTVYVSDQQRSLDFYVDKLGFEKRADRDMGPAGRWIEVRPTGSDTGLVLADGNAFGKQDRVGSAADLIFATDDVHAAHASVVARGVPATEPNGLAWGTSFVVTDPDGLEVLIMQPR
ncbi:VOC family protein [Mycobacterium deserti]|uniref:VOC family protein n=1 Tax=Mycobacterium deserti TaxID=2978347 RepID=A0ABT2M5C0_9MYCO|nr:VOC family protein [Mycobacterium deserti]MCT7657458.1 VOC family protein [Mycobacterium deserti]